MKKRKIEKIVIGVGIVVMICLILFSSYRCINFVLKGASSAAMEELFLIMFQTSWLMTYLIEFKNINLLELNDINNEIIRLLELKNQYTKKLLRIEGKSLRKYYRQVQNACREIYKIANTGIVNGLSPDRYVSFVFEQNNKIKNVLESVGYYDAKK